MTFIEAIRLGTATGYTIITIVIAYAIRHWARPSEKPLWALAATATAAHAALFWLAAFSVLPPPTRQVLFNVGHWPTFAMFAAWLFMEREKHRGQ